MAPKITNVIQAITNAKTNKVVGPDEIPTELVKPTDDDNINILQNLFNAIYMSGSIPQYWLIPKTTHTKKL